MSTVQLRASLALWRRRNAFRQKRLDVAHQVNDAARISKWEKLRRDAGRQVHLLEAELNAKRPLRIKAFEFAVQDLGEHEVGGNNVGPWVSMVIRAMGGTPGESWCGDAVGYWYKRAGSKLVERMWASTIWLASHLKAVKHPLRGHIVVYDFGTPGPKHTGLFDVWEVVGVSFWAIEGNTRKHSTTSDGFGGRDGVVRQLRTVDQVDVFRSVIA